MAEGSSPEPSAEVESDASSEHIRPLATRRDFLVGAGAGAVAVGVVAGAGVAATRGNSQTVSAPAGQTGPGGPAVAVPGAPGVQPAAPGQQQASPAAPQKAAQQLPASMRQVTLNIDGGQHQVTVDVRDSLWETMTRNLGLAGSNLGCDRAQCGACSVLVDGRAVNSCSVYTARLGRGQKIMTVASLAQGPGVDGLHPIQRAFWEDGGFQCGICTRGFIMSTYALLQANPNPSDSDISESLAGNICRCGEYPKIYTSVKNAAAMMAGQQVTHVAPSNVFLAPVVAPATSNTSAGSATGGTSKDFEFVTALSTIEEFEPMASPVKTKPGVLEVTGSERTITVKWDPSKVDEAGVRKYLADSGHPVK